MKKLTLALLVGSAILSGSAISAENNRTLSYFTSWGDYTLDAVNDLSKSGVDTFLLSFGGWDAEGNISSSDKIIDVPAYNAYYFERGYLVWTQTKLAHPEKKMMVAFGGETYESMWSHLGNATNREKIAQGLVKLLKTNFPVYKKNLKPTELDGPCQDTSWDGTCNLSNYQKAGSVQLDGIDFDYEKQARLTPEENDNLLKLAQRVRELLGPKSNKLLSLTTYHVGADPEACMSNTVMENCSFIEDKRSSHHGEVLPLLKNGKDTFDFFNVMTYDAGKNFRYQVALENYAKAVGNASKILLGNTINSQWGPDGRFTETRENNLARAAWQAENGYGGFFVWTLGANNNGITFGEQVNYINDMKKAAGEGHNGVENHKPTAVVKYNPVATGAAHVVLDGSHSSDPEGDSLTWRWEQVSGPAVTLINNDRPKASFDLNSTDADAELGFRLTVNDGAQDSVPFEFTITHKADQKPVDDDKPVDDKPVDGDKPVDDKPVDDNKPDNGAQGSWKSDKVYVGGDTVTWKGKEYKARWWTQNNQPGTSDVWENMSKADKEEWSANATYLGGDRAEFSGKSWKAKWWTRGDQPGSSDVWEQIK